MQPHVDLCAHVFTQKAAISLPPVCFPVIGACCAQHELQHPVDSQWCGPELPVGFVVEAAPGHSIQL